MKPLAGKLITRIFYKKSAGIVLGCTLRSVRRKQRYYCYRQY